MTKGVDFLLYAARALCRILVPESLRLQRRDKVLPQ